MITTATLRPLLLPCLLALPWSAPAQDRGAALDGERHVYKSVGEADLALYVYRPPGHEATDKTPAIVFYFGGGWKNGNPRQFEPHCKHLAATGMVAITADYRVSSRHDVKIEDCIADARSAMRWVRGNSAKLGIHPERIAAGGGSAGGHLAAAVALIDAFDAESDDESVSPRPDALVLFNPALAVAPNKALPEEYNTGIGERLRERSRGPIAKVSPLTYAGKKQPPCIMFFGTADKLLVGAEAFREVSTAAGNTCSIVTYDGQGHGFFNHGKNGGKYYELTVGEMDCFLARHGFLPGKEPTPPAGLRTDTVR